VGNDINVVNAIKIGKTKCSAIVNNVFDTCSFNSLVKKLQKSPFSLMIDEYTDIGSVTSKPQRFFVNLKEWEGGGMEERIQ